MTDADDYEAELARQLQPPSSRGFFVAIVAALSVGFLFKNDIKRRFRPAAAPYAAADHEAGTRAWMTTLFPKYVVAVSRGDPQPRQEAGRALVEGSRFHESLAWHSEMLVDALEDYIAWSKDTLIQDIDDARDTLEDSQRAIDELEAMLRDSGVPFSVDARITAHREGTKWKLNFLARTSEVLATTRFKAGDEVVEVLRVRRLDGLALRDLVHGKAKNGRAMVLEEGPRLAVVGRLMPGLGELPEVRDLGSDEQSPLNGSQMAAALEALLPEDVRPHAAAIGELARRRRDTLEALDGLLRRRKARLIEPPEFFVTEAFHDGMARRFGTTGFVEDLKRFSVLTGLDPDLKAATERAADALVEHYTAGVERHEAWHLLLPDPPPVEGLHPGASVELAAYVGELADAGDELPLVWDAVLRLAAQAKANPRPTATNLAVIHLVEQVKPPYGPPLAEQLAHVQRRATELKKTWFHEERSLARLD
jgi:hypothetical protein